MTMEELAGERAGTQRTHEGQSFRHGTYWRLAEMTKLTFLERERRELIEILVQAVQVC
jgi:hypothetical protein